MNNNQKIIPELSDAPGAQLNTAVFKNWGPIRNPLTPPHTISKTIVSPNFPLKNYIILKNFNKELSYDRSSNATSVYIYKGNKISISTDIRTSMFVAALLTIAKRWKQPKWPSMGEQMNNIQYTRTMEYYSALRKEILPHTTTRMTLKDIRLSKISPSGVTLRPSPAHSSKCLFKLEFLYILIRTGYGARREVKSSG